MSSWEEPARLSEPGEQGFGGRGRNAHLTLQVCLPFTGFEMGKLRIRDVDSGPLCRH